MRLELRLGLALIAFLGPVCVAQSNDDGRANAPRRMTGLGGVHSQPGVKSAAPGRMSGLGGVRSQPGVKSEAPRSFSTPLRVNNRPASGPGLKNPGNGPSMTRPALSNPTLSNRPGQGQSTGGGSFELPHGFHRVPDGLNISGSFSDGPFTLVFHTGGLSGNHHHHHHKDCAIFPVFHGGCSLFPYWPIGSFYDGFGVAYGYNRGYDYVRPIIGEPAPPPAPAAEPEPLSPEQHAAAMLKFGDSKAAIVAYQSIVKSYPNDSESLRALGLSLIDNGQVGDGVAIIGMAYRADATLAANPIPRDVYGKATNLRNNLTRVSSYANREKSASAWLTLAVLMQAEGRTQPALTMVERAQAAGLEQQIAQELISALPAPSRTR
jgi:hypothetical protein